MVSARPFERDMERKTLQGDLQCRSTCIASRRGCLIDRCSEGSCLSGANLAFPGCLQVARFTGAILCRLACVSSFDMQFGLFLSGRLNEALPLRMGASATEVWAGKSCSTFVVVVFLHMAVVVLPGSGRIRFRVMLMLAFLSRVDLGLWQLPSSDSGHWSSQPQFVVPIFSADDYYHS